MPLAPDRARPTPAPQTYAPEWEDTWRHVVKTRTPPFCCHRPNKNTDFRFLEQDWYKGAPTVVTTNICLPLGVDSNTADCIGRNVCPETATFAPIEVPAAGGRITIQLARCIMLQVQVPDGQGLSPHFPRLTDGQFPYILPQTQALSVTLPNRQFTIMSDAFAPSPGAA